MLHTLRDTAPPVRQGQICTTFHTHENFIPSSRPSITQGCWRYRLPGGPHMTRRYSRFRRQIMSLGLFSSEFIPRPYGTNPLRRVRAQIAEVSADRSMREPHRCPPRRAITCWRDALRSCAPLCLMIFFTCDPLKGLVTYLSSPQRSQMRQIPGAHPCLGIAYR